MPTYEYHCAQGHDTEDFVSMSQRHAGAECGFELSDGLLCAETRHLTVSAPLCHIWEERAARTILTRSPGQQMFRGRLKDGTEYNTMGGHHPKADAKGSDGD